MVEKPQEEDSEERIARLVRATMRSIADRSYERGDTAEQFVEFLRRLSVALNAEAASMEQLGKVVARD